MDPELLQPDWPAPPGVRAVATTRRGGLSAGVYASLNLGTHVGDDPAAVRANRRRLADALLLPAVPRWLDQVHGVAVHRFGSTGEGGVRGDASVAAAPGQVCAVLTADCLPVLLCSRSGAVVAAAHAGWRGLAAGVLENTVAAMDMPPADVMAWLGPAIGPGRFEVGDEVREAFVGQDPSATEAFAANPRGRWMADLYTLARQRLARIGVGAVTGGGLCTFEDGGRFFSYRRDGATGRQACLIWIAGG